jgi:hypothetical protein
MAPRTPGVYIEEFHFPCAPILGLPTSNVGFIAVTGRGPLLGPLTSFADFEQLATPNLGVNLPLAQPSQLRTIFGVFAISFAVKWRVSIAKL